jgi:PGF-CTERM protein
MRRERALAAAAAVVVVFALLVATAVPGVVSAPEDGPVRPGRVDVTDVTIEPTAVSGETVTLRVVPYLRHGGNPTPNVTLTVRATDGESGMLETARRVDVGEITGEREITAPANLTVEREGSYRIEVLVYQDGRRIETGGRTVSGLEALTPAYARTSVGFVDERQLPPVAVSVREAGTNRTTLDVSAWLTNRGDDPAEGLSVTVILRQADSNLVAAETTADVGRIGGGETAAADATVTVPAEYNYYVDVLLRTDGVVVDTARSTVNLDPTETIAANTTTREVELDVSDFERRPGGGATPAAADATTVTGSPGFGAGVAGVALLAAALLARRWGA